MTIPDVDRLAFLGVSATGPDPFRHQLFEVALLLGTTLDPDLEDEEPSDEWESVDWEDKHFWLSVDLSSADASTLRSRTYHERHPLGHDDRRPQKDRENEVSSPDGAARAIARLTAGRFLVAADPAAPELFLRGLLMTNEECPLWSGLIDVDALAAGTLAAKNMLHALPWLTTDVLAMDLGVKGEYLSEAQDDAQLARAVYEAVLGE
jgi:hypothetical protein